MSWLLQTVLWWTLEYTCLFQFWFPRSVCPAVGLWGHMAVLFPVFKGISTLFSIVAVLVCIPTNSVRGFPFSTPSLAFIACRFLDRSHSDWCEMVLHCGFYLHFSDNEWCWASFHVFVSHLWRNVYLVLQPIFLLVRLFFWNWAAGVSCIFLRLILCQLLCLLLYRLIFIFKVPQA